MQVFCLRLASTLKSIEGRVRKSKEAKYHKIEHIFPTERITVYKKQKNFPHENWLTLLT